MALLGAFDDQVDHDDPVNDRFTTKWMGLMDKRATLWAALKGVSYGRGGICNERLTVRLDAFPGGSPFYSFIGDREIDEEKFVAENKAHDDEVRAMFAHDIDLSTGEGYVRGSWDHTNRGEKLRTCAFNRASTVIDNFKMDAIKDHYESSLTDDATDAGLAQRIQRITSSIEALLTLKQLIDQLEQMVKDEVNPEWDWKIAIAAQVDVIRQQPD